MESGSRSEAVAAPTGPESKAEQSPSTAAEGSSSAAAVATGSAASVGPPSRYESQKRRDWNTFLQYLQDQNPPLTLPRCSRSDGHVIEFLKYLDQFGKTKVHLTECPYFGQLHPIASCGCPLKQAWGSLDALIGRLRAAYDENGGGRPETNPFGARAVRIYLKEVREDQAKARGIPYEKKRKRTTTVTTTSGAVEDAGKGGGGGGSGGVRADD